MARSISASVGEKGVNRKEDAVTVQELLNSVPAEKGGASPKLDPDGLPWGKTIAAIKHFQKVACAFKSPDGRVDPNQITINKLNELSGPSDPNEDRFVGFTPARKAMLQADIAAAKKLAFAAFASLLPAIPFPRLDQKGKVTPTKAPFIDPEVSALLQDVFAIDGSDLSQVANIQAKFRDFNGRMDTVKFIFSKDHPPEKHVGFVVIPVFGFTQNEIFLTESYFAADMGAGNFPAISAETARALTLIHEFIHLYGEVRDHPGGQPVLFMRSRMGIKYEDAKWNPWCYENYAKWLRKAI